MSISGIVIPQPPRMTGDSQTDARSLTNWFYDFYKALILNKGAVLSQDQYQPIVFDPDNLTDPAKATIYSAQLTANAAYLLARLIGERDINAGVGLDGGGRLVDGDVTIDLKAALASEIGGVLLAAAVADAGVTGAPPFELIADGTTATLGPMPSGYSGAAAVDIRITWDGAVQHPTVDYSVSGLNLVFTSIPPYGTIVAGVLNPATNAAAQLNALLASLRAAGTLDT